MKKLTALLSFFIFFSGCIQRADCNYKLPEGYFLAESNAGGYAIAKKGDRYPDEYLEKWNPLIKTPRFYWHYQGSNGITVFKDSCKALGAAKEYFEQYNGKTFKPVK